jgi:hypothetical protein
MKTIIDAVNELRGDLNNVSHIKGDDTYHCNVNYNDDSGWWCSRGVYGDFVCTIDDFQIMIDRMMLDSPDYFFKHIAVNKEPLKPGLIDGKAYQFECDKGELHGIYDHILEWFVAKELRVFVDEVTNIQPLTVGDK